MHDFGKNLRKWLLVPRDFETFRRSLLRKLNILPRGGASQIISGDTFKKLCDYVVEGLVDNDFEYFSQFQNLSGRLFVQAEPDSNASKLLIEACAAGLRFPELELIIHNGDQVPGEPGMQLLNKSFKSVFSVNWLGGSEIAKPLPIGLENAAKLRNGVQKDFIREINRGLKPLYQRDIELLVCFSIWTNSAIRTEALNWARTLSGATIIDKPITPRAYRKLVLRSKYVLSPPGNGADCHRTWEALYLGAVPVVLDEYWPFSDYDIPVLSLRNWGEFESRVKHNHLPCSSDWKNVSSWLR